MYDQNTLSELTRFARVDAGATVIDVYPGEGDWTRLFSDAVGPEGRVYSFVPAEVTHFKNDPLGRMRELAAEPGRENVEAVSADLVALGTVTQAADVVWLHIGPGLAEIFEVGRRKHQHVAGSFPRPWSGSSTPRNRTLRARSRRRCCAA